MKRLVIDRKKWDRGNGDTDHQVRLSSRYGKCCLGFYAEQVLGVPTERITDRTTLAVAGIDCPLTFLRGNHRLNATLGDKMMLLNDAPGIEDAERERQLTEMFKEIDVEVVFEN